MWDRNSAGKLKIPVYFRTIHKLDFSRSDIHQQLLLSVYLETYRDLEQFRVYHPVHSQGVVSFSFSSTDFFISIVLVVGVLSQMKARKINVLQFQWNSLTRLLELSVHLIVSVGRSVLLACQVISSKSQMYAKFCFVICFIFHCLSRVKRHFYPAVRKPNSGEISVEFHHTKPGASKIWTLYTPS